MAFDPLPLGAINYVAFTEGINQGLQMCLVVSTAAIPFFFLPTGPIWVTFSQWSSEED